MWSGTPKAMEIFIGHDRPLDPKKYFIILPGQFANGFSSVSPAKSPCLLTFWPSCSPKRTTDLFPNGIDAIRTERLMPAWSN